MDNHDSHLKPQQTGGLKLMTVFIAVLALHVVVIGGITVYHLMSGGNTDGDLVTDKSHKEIKVATDGDGTLPDGSSADKSASTTPAATSPTSGPTPDSTASTDASSPPATAPTPAPITPAPAPAPAVVVTNPPTGPVLSGPVVTPAQSSTPEPSDITADQEATPAPTAANEETEAGTPYTVKSHDSLARIAHQHHITVASLRAANNLKSDLLQIGQKLVIPARTETASASSPADKLSAPKPAPVSSGPDRTLLGDSIPDAADKQPVASTSHDEAMVAPAISGRHLYTVVKGDTLSKIAHKFHTTAGALMAANSIADARKMRIGQKLRIPSQEPRSATAAPAPIEPMQQQAQPEPIEPRATPSAQLANFMP